ncbi:hypothetical protein CDAR_241841 [Caerostris darwini]|uniref:Ycf15 n=1 Tax=Caerostris darwini TaxID=1538125 RepID=A0AAV4NLR4_9ARAC|nr:hypothetical protein CDAR_241841 [Caerostris darwini]
MNDITFHARFLLLFEMDSGEHIPLRNMHWGRIGKKNESKHPKFIHLSLSPSIRTFFSGHSLRTRAFISVLQGPRDEISSSGDHDPNEKNRPPTNNNNRMVSSELGLLWGEEESSVGPWGSRMREDNRMLP